ncbi:hypothetical protein CTAYLR_005591 [Chrysophaeum taylorii]|uniref:SET domain-containing protein n=1 Tax=Chrysophaeum taylorii TaxID=2483200 RepID=A0AAD7U4B2_9STRA|nr:hypothetical protein CTAYLR_005591 [Chrysophaeum taylorii]
MPRSVRRRRRRVARTRVARDAFVDSCEMFELAAAAAASSTTPFVSVPLPLRSLVPAKKAMALCEMGGKGRGLVATRDLPEGTTLCCEKAIAMTMDWEHDDDESAAESAGEGNADAARLLLRVCAMARRNPGLWFESGLSELFPRSRREARGLAAWGCSNSVLDAAVRDAVTTLRNERTPGNWGLLPLIVRHNAVDVSTCGETLSYPSSPLVGLAGLALYARSSAFNHDDDPNVLRWHCGDVGVWRTNRFVRAGQELCVSYVESDLLRTPALKREALAHFEPAVRGGGGGGGGEIVVRALDVAAQNRWMQLDPEDRLAGLAKLRPKIACDKIQHRVLRAVSFASLGKAADARREFLEVVRLCKRLLPPNDEQTVVFLVHAARAALASGEPNQAAALLGEALAAHAAIFGGGQLLFECRFATDLELDLGYRPDPDLRRLCIMT